MVAVAVADRIGVLLADAWYCTDATLAAAEPTGPRLLMPTYNLRKDCDVTDAYRATGCRVQRGRRLQRGHDAGPAPRKVPALCARSPK